MSENKTIAVDTKSTHRKDNMINDLFVLGQLWRNKEISNDAINSILEKYSWYLTEYQPDDKGVYQKAKYQGCPFWSEGALNEYELGNVSVLRHEHVIPRRIFMQSVWERICKTDGINEVNKRIMTQQIKDGLIGCVVTEKEAYDILDKESKNTMPDGKTDFFEIVEQALIWERYEVSKISIFKVKWERKGRQWKKTTVQPFLKKGEGVYDA